MLLEIRIVLLLGRWCFLSELRQSRRYLLCMKIVAISNVKCEIANQLLTLSSYFLPLAASSSAFCLALFSLFPTRRASLRALRNRTYWLLSFSASSILRSVTAGAGAGKGRGGSIFD